MTAVFLVPLYLGAIVLANLVSAHFGPRASIVNAFGLIGLTLTTRDRLDDAWGRNRLRNMTLLILVGSALSYVAALLIGAAAAPAAVAQRIALASCVAFAANETGDFLIYQRLRDRPWLERANVSNLLSASIDSVVFVSIAFGFDWYIVTAQIFAKVAGGFEWSLILRRQRARRVAVEPA